MAKNFLGVKSMADVAGTITLYPAVSAAQNKANFQAAADDDAITEIWLAPGVFDFEDEIFLHGKKSLFGYSGATMRLIQDMGALGKSSLAYTFGGWLHLGSRGVGLGLNEWYDSTIAGIDFRFTPEARCSVPMYFHTAQRCDVRECYWKALSADVGTLMVDSTRNFVYNGRETDYATPIPWGKLFKLSFINNRILTDDNAPAVGGAAVGLRMSYCTDLLYDGNSIIGVGDDCIAASMCDGVRMVNNYGETPGGRFLIDESQNSIVSHNHYKRTAARDGQYYYGAAFGAKNILTPASFTAIESQGEFSLYPRNNIISHNTMEFPAETASSSQGIMLGGVHNCIVEDNIIVNHSTSYISVIQVYEDGANVRSPGLPYDIRRNQNLIIRNNIVESTPGSSSRGRLWIHGIDQNTISTLTIIGTGDFVIEYLDVAGTLNVTDPITASPTLNAAAVLSALQNIPGLSTDQGVDLDNITVTGVDGGPFTIDWIEVSYQNTTDRVVDVSLPAGTTVATMANNTPPPEDPGDNIVVENNIVDEWLIEGPGSNPITAYGNVIKSDPTETARQKVQIAG